MNEPEATSSEGAEQDAPAVEDATDRAPQGEAFGEELSGVVETRSTDGAEPEGAEAGEPGRDDTPEPPEAAAPSEGAQPADEEGAPPERRVEQLLDQLDAPSQASERAAILREVAQLYEGPLGEPEHALLAWVQALTEDPGDEQAFEGVARLARSPEQWLEAVGSFNEALPNLASQPQLAAQMYALLGRCYREHLGRSDLAAPCFTQALQLAPTLRGALEGSIALCRETQAWEALVSNLMHALSLTEDPTERRALLTEAADTLYRKLGDGDRALPLYAQLLQDDPQHEEAERALEELYRARGDHRELVALLERRADLVEGDARSELLLEIGLLHKDALADVARATRYFEEAVEAGPANTRALEELSGVLEERGEVKKLLDVLETRAKLAETPKERCDLHARRAVLLEQHVGDFEGAIASYQRVVDLDPGRTEAYEALARLLRRAQDFPGLLAALDHHAKSLTDSDAKAALLLEAARVAIGDLGDAQSAAQLCERALGLCPDHQEALKLAARLRTALGDADGAVDALDVLADAELDAARRAARLVEAGQLLEERGQPEDAVDRYRAALEAVGSMPAAVEALRRLYATLQDYKALAELLQSEADATPDDARRAALLLELAEVRREHLDEAPQAAEVYRASLALSPDNAAAALALGDIAFEAGEWEEAASYLEPLLSRTAQLPQGAPLRVALRAGEALRALGHQDRAREAYEKARVLEPTNGTALRALAELATANGRPAEAAQHYQALLDAQRAELSVAEVSELLQRLGEALETDGQPGPAAAAFQEAAELTPAEDAPLAALARAQRAIEDWEGLLKTQRRRLASAAGADRVSLLEEMGQVLAERLDRPDKAVECFEAAREQAADNRNVLARLMALYTKLEDWPQLVETLEALARLGGEPEVAAKYLYTAGAMASERLHDAARAAQLFARTLEVDPGHPRALDSRLQALRDAQDWTALAEGLETKLARQQDAQTSAQQRAELWDELATLRIERLAQRDAGLEALEQAQALAPDPARDLRLLRLYSESPKQHAEALVRVCNRALAHDASEADAYRALRTLYTQLEQPDAVWCVCQALKALGLANDEEVAFFRKHRTMYAAEARACIEDDAWSQMLRHPDEDPLLTEIFATLAPAAVAVYARPPEALGLSEDMLVDPATDTHLLARMLHYAAGVLMFPMPRLYHQPDAAVGVQYLPTQPPSLSMGRGASQEVPDQAVAFLAARQIAYLQRGFFMRQLEPSGRGLRAWLLAAIRRSMPTFPVPSELSAAVERNAQAIEQHLDDEDKAQLDRLVAQLLEEAPELDLKRWARAVDFTTDRLGLVLANNLAACLAVVEASGDDQSVVPKTERVDALRSYAVSPQYLALRQHLGIALS